MTKQEEVAQKLAMGRKFNLEIKPTILKALRNVHVKNEEQTLSLDFLYSLVEESCSMSNLEELLKPIQKNEIKDVPYNTFNKKIVGIINTTKEAFLDEN